MYFLEPPKGVTNEGSLGCFFSFRDEGFHSYRYLRCLFICLFLLLRRAIKSGYFTVISNYSVPLRSLLHRCNSVGLDAKSVLESSKMAIIDVFGSRYSPLRIEIENVLYLDKVEPETIKPKIDRIYCGSLRDKLKSEKVVRMIYTLDGATLMLGEEQTPETTQSNDSNQKH